MMRPPGRGKPREARRFDKTSCQERQYGRMVHRDYAAHFFRWGFAERFCAGKRVLDVGCGKDVALYEVLVHHGRMAKKAEKYVGVDLNPLRREMETKLADAIGEFDFVARRGELLEKYGPFEVACCFEVIEHMGEEDGDALLRGIWECLRPGGTLLLSTPAASGKPARNHVREYAISELRAKVERAGFSVLQRFGTFGDVNRIKASASPEERIVEARLAEYYSHEVLSCFLAPLHPDACKNNLWVLEKNGNAKVSG